MEAEVQARHNLEVDLRQAIADGGLEVHYQPVVSLATMRSRAARRWFAGGIPSAA